MNEERHQLIDDLKEMTEERDDLDTRLDKALKRIDRQDEKIDAQAYQIKNLEGDLAREFERAKTEKAMNEKIIKDLEKDIENLKL